MCHVVDELSQFCVLWADIHIKGRSDGRCLSVKPVAVSVRACSMVTSENVVWIGDPEACGCLISIEETPGTTNINHQIIFNQVLRLSCILNKDRVAHGVVDNIVLDSEEVDTVDCHCSVECVVNGIVPHIRAVHSANHVEVNGVAAKDERLADIC